MLLEQIDQSSIIALIGLLGTVLPVGISYVLTKNKEIDVSIRQEKTERYDGLISALVMIVRSDLDDDDPLDNFITAYNSAMAYASDLVLERCNEFLRWLYEQLYLHKQEEVITIERGRERSRHITGIYAAIRLDINPKAKYSKVFALTSLEKERTNK